MKVLVTGASGFVGSAVAAAFQARGDEVRGVSRSSSPHVPSGLSLVAADFVSDAGLGGALPGCDVLVHAAARVHVMKDTASDSLAEFRRVNTAATAALAAKAAADGVRRFIFISSIKVVGERSAPGRPLASDHPPQPVGPYGVSKYEAEVELCRIAAVTGLELVIIRPVLVYGPGVRGNFHSMLRQLWRRVPLPLGAVQNKRSLVARDNLVDLVVRCADHPAAAGATLHVSDGHDLSTPELLRRAGNALGRPARLVHVPVSVLELAGAVLGKREAVKRLTGSLQVDIEATKSLLGWRPPVGVDAALSATAESFIRSRGGEA